jgi:hypothetical protein
MAHQGFNTNWIGAYEDKEGFLKSWGAMNTEEAKKLLNDSAPDSISGALITRSQKKLRNLPNYDQYEDEIEAFINLIKLSEKDRKHINLNVKENWLSDGKLIK